MSGSKKQTPKAEARFWRRIAKRFVGVQLGERYVSGLCAEIGDVVGVSETVKDTARSRLSAHMKAWNLGSFSFLYPDGERLLSRGGNDDKRCLFALWLALEAEDEANAL